MKAHQRSPEAHPARPRRFPAALGVAVCLALGGCPAYLRVPGTCLREPRARSRFTAGVGVADLTPPPGFPTGGHGPAGGFARGQLGRLQARAFAFLDRDGHALVLVSCDLFAMPGGLQREVAHLVEQRTRDLDVSLGLEGLVLAATHTHQSPGNYLTAEAYNAFGARQAGFSRSMFAFLADRIADATVAALREAALSEDPAALEVYTGSMEVGLVRNRSPLSFELNHDRDDLLERWSRQGCERLDPGEAPCVRGESEPADGWNLPRCPRLCAVDRLVTVVKVLRGGELLGGLVFMSAHPTVLRHDAPLYSADFAGVAMQVLEHRYRTPHARLRPVFGFFNGAEGDVTMRRQARDLRETFEFGSAVARQVRAMLDSGRPAVSIRDGPRIDLRTTRVRWSLEEARSCRSKEGGVAALAPEPLVGVAALGGAEDDRTAFYGMGWKEGVLGLPQGSGQREAQGLKTPALYSDLLPSFDLTPLLAPPAEFPQELPFTLAEIGPLRLAAVPFEMSSAVGLLVRDRVGTPEGGALAVVGLANEYGLYVASEDEYQAQDYMASFTLWGPHEGPFVACVLEGLKDHPPTHARRIPEELYRVGPLVDRFGMRALSGNVDKPAEGLGAILLDGQGLPTTGVPWLEWEEPLPPRSLVSDAMATEGLEKRIAEIPVDPEWAAGAKREVRVLRRERCGARLLGEDRGPEFVTILLGTSARDPSRQRWATLWLGPMLGRPPGTYELIVDTDGRRVCSKPMAVPGSFSDPVPVADSCPDIRGDDCRGDDRAGWSTE